MVAPHAAHRTCRGVRQDVIVGVLEPIELLNQQRIRVGPLHTSDVVCARITSSAIQVTGPPVALTTPTRTAEFVVPASG